MFCSFVVFVMPLIFGAISGNIVYIYYDKPSFAIILASVIAGLIIGILTAKFIIRLTINDNGENKIGH